MTPISAREGYDLWAEAWDETPSPIVALEQRSLLPWLEGLHSRRTVDIGCGTGRWTELLSAIGIDTSPAMLAIAAGKPGIRGRLALADATALPIATSSTDLVICALTLGHIRDHATALAELARILEPGGALILTDFHPSAAAHGWRRTFRHDGQVYELENHPYTVGGLRSLASGMRLTESAEVSIGEPERELFHRADRPELFESARSMPAVLLTRWIRL
jgi:SAM-dependent methyltransferase